MPLKAGLMYKPSAVAFDTVANSVYVVEHFNHRVSKWVYLPGAPSPENFIFNIDAGRITAITVNTGGSDYSVGNPVIIDPPTLPGISGVTATAVVASLSGSAIATVRVTNQGSGYDSGNLPSVNAPTTGTPATFNPVTVAAIWGPQGNGTTGQAGDSTSTTDNFLYHPSGIILNNARTRLYLTDTFNHRIRVINPTTGLFTSSVGQGGTGDTDLYRPFGIAVNTLDTVLVIADEFNRRAVKYVPGDPPTFSAILTEPTPKKFVKPHGVSFNIDDINFIISDTFRGVLNRYDDTATSFESQNGKASGGDGNDDLYYPGSGAGAFPADFETLFANTRKNSLKKYNAATGALVNFLTGVAGTNDGQLYWPESSSIFTDTANYLLVANTENNRVEVFDQTPVFKNNFGR